MRVTRRRGRVRVNLAEAEVGVLAALFDDLAVALDTLGPDDPVRQRLFPAGHRDDPAAAAEFRELTESALHQGKIERVGACRAELPSGGGNLELDPESLERWLTVLNDLRLALGTRLGVTEQDDPDVDLTDPDSQTRAVYYWLTAMQDSMVTAAPR